MTVSLMRELHGARVLEFGGDGAALSRPQDAAEFIGAALQARADWVCLPVERLAPAFFDLKTGLAGAALQKFENYRISLAIVGALHAAAGRSFKDFMLEANRGRRRWFVADRGEFERRLHGALYR